jgi:hypothetical protein
MKLVSIRNVKIHASMLALTIVNVEYRIISQLVYVPKVILAMPLNLAIE